MARRANAPEGDRGECGIDGGENALTDTANIALTRERPAWKVSRAERIRRARLGDLKHLLRCRYRGDVLPEDDAGHGDRLLLLELASLDRSDPRESMARIISVHAPWTTSPEEKIEAVLKIPFRERKRSNVELGQLLGLRNAERERHKIWSIAPFDVTADELAEQRKRKKAERDRLRRMKGGAASRAVYRAKSLTKLEPWKAEGLSRATWYRRRETSPHQALSSVDGAQSSHERKASGTAALPSGRSEPLGGSSTGEGSPLTSCWRGLVSRSTADRFIGVTVCAVIASKLSATG